MAAGGMGGKDKLLAVISQLEAAFESLNVNLKAVKETAQNLDVQNSENTAEPSDITVKIDENYKCENGVKTEDSRNWYLDSFVSGAELPEPEAVKEHREAKKESEEVEALKEHIPTAIGFGFQSVEKKNLRMSPEWMEFSKTCNNALEAAVANSGSEDTQSILLHAVSSKKTINSKTRRASRTSIIVRDSSSMLKVRFNMISPHAPYRILWDLASCILLVIDAFTLPIMLAWDLDANTVTAGGTFLAMLMILAIAFWSLDIALNFNTGYYSGGSLVLDRKRVTKHYLKGWFLFDSTIVGIDIIMTAASLLGTGAGRIGDSLQNVRAARLLRAARFLRLMKIAKINVIIEEVAVAGGRPWLVMVISMVKTICGILVATHVISCTWYYIGRVSIEAGQRSWLDITKLSGEEVAVENQYMYALSWVLQPPFPAQVDSSNMQETFFNQFMTVFAIAVMGASIGQLTSILSEMRALNSERTRKRREVRHYLKSQNTSIELTSRIMRFVDHKLALEDARSGVDVSLISPNLQMELHVQQRNFCMVNHPLFHLVSELYPGVYARICGACVKHVYERDEIIFSVGSFAQAMLITALGKYTLADSEDDTKLPVNGVDFEGVRWFGEPSIFTEAMIHLKTLKANSFADAFGLSSEDLRAALLESPACGHMVGDYAKDFVELLQKKADAWTYDFYEKSSFDAVKLNVQYMLLHPDPDSDIHHFGITSEKDDVNVENPAEVDAEITAKSFVAKAMSGAMSDQEQLLKCLEQLFPELEPAKGTHTKFSPKGERERALASCLSMLNLLADRYDNFTSPQNPTSRLTAGQWIDLRALCKWCAPDEATAHALIVLLAIRGLGKAKLITQQLQRHCKATRPEDTVIALVEGFDNVVPSVRDLADSQKQLLITTLQVHRDFNFAQMMQGENVPSNIKQLREMLSDNMDLFRLYILFFVGFISGVASGSGSRFMDSNNAPLIIQGCKALGALMSSTAQGVYWGYICMRGDRIGIPVITAFDLVLVRLTCLSRIKDKQSYLKLHRAWVNTSAETQAVLLNHFLADGITERAFVLEFLPLCIANARGNKYVQLSALLEVLGDLVTNLHCAMATAPKHYQDCLAIVVDVSDLAEFISAVRNRFVFQTCMTRSTLRYSKSEPSLVLEMTTNNWARIMESGSDLSHLSQEVRHVTRMLDAQGQEFEGGHQSTVRRVQPRISHERQLQNRSASAGNAWDHSFGGSSNCFSV